MKNYRKETTITGREMFKSNGKSKKKLIKEICRSRP
jgi:hypothetical protein